MPCARLHVMVPLHVAPYGARMACSHVFPTCCLNAGTSVLKLLSQIAPQDALAGKDAKNYTV